jgi:putative spermidine/putrescine transport system substrate-binding protein
MTTATLSRRAVLSGLAGAAALPAAGRAQGKKFNDASITVATFAGPWIDRINAELGASMKDAGINMHFVGGMSEDFLAKMIASRGQSPPFNVMEIADETYADFRRGDFLAKLNFANLPNLSHLDHSSYDDYQVANWATEPAIIYNVDKFNAIGLPPPKTYTDLINPALRGHVLLSDVNTYNGYYEVLGLAFENGGDEKNPEPGFTMMEKIKPQSYTASVATTMQLYSSGDVWASTSSAHLAIRIFDSGVNVATVHPVIKGHKVALARGYLAVVKGSPDQDVSEYYINQMISTHMQDRLYLEAATIPVNLDSFKDVASKIRVDKAGKPFLIMDPASLANAWVPDFAAINKRDWVRRWQRAVAAQQ